MCQKKKKKKKIKQTTTTKIFRRPCILELNRSYHSQYKSVKFNGSYHRTKFQRSANTLCDKQTELILSLVDGARNTDLSLYKLAQFSFPFFFLLLFLQVNVERILIQTIGGIMVFTYKNRSQIHIVSDFQRYHKINVHQ